MQSKEKDSKLFDFLLGIFLVSLLAIPGYFFYNTFLHDALTEGINTEGGTVTNPEDEKQTEENTLSTYSENPVEGESFFEKFPILDNQQTYIAIPMQVDTLTPPSIVIYIHGDLEELTDSISTEFMKKLRSYAEVFASNNYIFTASYIHDNDNALALDDINNLIDWIKENYIASTDIYLIGFSRGGYTTTSYTLTYPENIKAIALLAPATYYTEWYQNEIDIVIDIPIKIWHGTDDVNIGIVHSEYFVERLAEYGKTVEMEEIEDATHYDIDDEYIDKILEFFEFTLQ